MKDHIPQGNGQRCAITGRGGGKQRQGSVADSEASSNHSSGNSGKHFSPGLSKILIFFTGVNTKDQRPQSCYAPCTAATLLGHPQARRGLG